jgi:hypothetical protein
MKFRDSTICLLILLLGSCNQQKELLEEINFPNVPPVLAVYCLLTPGDSILATVTTLRSVSDRLPISNLGIVEYPRVPDANVILKDLTTKQVITLRYLGREGRYGIVQSPNFSITPGSSYSLSVSKTGFPTLDATCQIPQKAAVIEQFSYGEPYNDGFFSRRRVELRWQDISTPAFSVNYFLTTAYQMSASENDRRMSTYYNKNISVVGTTYFYQNDALDNPYPRSFRLITASSAVFNFYKMAENMIMITSSGTGDPFGAYQGIVPEYTNVTGGYGIVGGYLSTQLVTAFK